MVLGDLFECRSYNLHAVHSLHVDVEKNRIHLTLEGVISLPETAQVEVEINEAMKKLRPGFDLITDLRDCKLGHLKGAYIYFRMVKKMQNSGLNRVVRIMGKSKIALRQLTALTKKIVGFKATYVSNLDAAERFLDDGK